MLNNFFEVELQELNAQMQAAITATAEQHNITITGISVVISNDNKPQLVIHYGGDYSGILEIPVAMETPTFTIQGISPTEN